MVCQIAATHQLDFSSAATSLIVCVSLTDHKRNTNFIGVFIHIVITDLLLDQNN